jgi:phosphoribosylaminoimidazole-succinocarboxamide synthase
MPNTITQIDIPDIKKLKSGKVREVFDLGHALLFVATDRISAFDVILPNPIPEKGRVLTALSEFWFGKTEHIVKNHFITSEFIAIQSTVGQAARLSTGEDRRAACPTALQGRSMLVRKCEPLPVECVVRGYLAGSGLREYKQSHTICGIKLPGGLVESSQLPQPIFTPATKAETGHDENIDFDRCAEILGKTLAEKVRDISLALYNFARDYAAQRGILIADTKFEFGLDGNKLLLIDEALTPDSSRFWPACADEAASARRRPADSYAPGKPQPSFDKQFVRDYLETLDWNKTAPGPVLPDEVIRKTSEKYLEALKRLTT